MTAHAKRTSVSIRRWIGNRSMRTKLIEGIAYLETYGWVYDANSVDFQGYPLKSTRLKDRVFIHTGLRYKQDNWSLRLRVFDLLDTGREYVQPYHSESTPYPGSGREVVFAFEWDW